MGRCMAAVLNNDEYKISYSVAGFGRFDEVGIEDIFHDKFKTYAAAKATFDQLLDSGEYPDCELSIVYRGGGKTTSEVMECTVSVNVNKQVDELEKL